MARYTDDSRDRVRDAVDMVDLVGTRVELRRAGANRYEGLCPFHDERTPSFGINPAEKLFYCFGCGTGGDAFRFVELTEGLDFKGSLERLADRYGVQLEVVEEDPAAAERRRARERLLELLERTAAFYARFLWDSREAAGAREYLLGRGLEETSLREFRVGYAPSAWDTVLLASRRAGFSDRELVAAGLAQRAKGAGRTYDRFRRRIMFPLCDTRGRVLGFGARAIGADQKPKYLNSSDTALFHKGRNLFGADIARAPAAKAGSVLVAEGYTDVIALHQAELRNTVGLMGTALTDEQVGELARLAPTVLLALDADSAGQDAMLRAARVATRQRLTLRVVPLPVDADPADLVQAEGASAILARVEASVPFVRFRVERELERGDLTTAEGRGAVISALRPLFAELTDEAVRQELLRLVCDRTDLSPNILSPELPSRGRSRPLAPADNTAPALGRALSAAGRAERTFLAHAVALPQAGRAALADLDIEDLFTEETNRRAALHLREHLGSPTLDSSGVDAPLSELLAELAVAGVRPSAAALEAETLKLKIRSVERKIKEAQHAQSGDVAALVTRRHELGRERDAAIARAMEETAAAR